MDEACRLRQGEGYEACEDEPPEAMHDVNRKFMRTELSAPTGCLPC